MGAFCGRGRAFALFLPFEDVVVFFGVDVCGAANAGTTDSMRAALARSAAPKRQSLILAMVEHYFSGAGTTPAK